MSPFALHLAFSTFRYTIIYNMPFDNKSKQVNIRLTNDQHQRLETFSKDQGGIPLSQIIRTALTKYLNELKKEDAGGRPRT